LEIPSDPNLIVGLEGFEDAGVYRLTDDLAIIQTVDYFTPIVDDPYDFGQIAVANALSDVYAMGGKPITAMNIVCFPSKTMDISILREILRGGIDKLKEAEVTLVGGHSVDDPELKYGLSVTGVIHPNKVVLNSGAKPGDKLILTKPLGTGIINTAIKANMADENTIATVSEQMTTLNRKTSEIMQETGVNACTDVTGFGLLGHACEMIQNNDIGLEIHHSSVPILAEAPGFAQMGLIPGGAYRNKDFRASMVEFATGIPDWIPDVLFDPQTSGGLLISVPPEKVETLLVRLRDSGHSQVSIIGQVTDQTGKILVL
jgi:selenide,water dikinase